MPEFQLESNGNAEGLLGTVQNIFKKDLDRSLSIRLLNDKFTRRGEGWFAVAVVFGVCSSFGGTGESVGSETAYVLSKRDTGVGHRSAGQVTQSSQTLP